MIFLIVYSRIRSGFALRGIRNKSPALRLALFKHELCMLDFHTLLRCGENRHRVTRLI